MKTFGGTVLIVGLVACVLPQSAQAGTKCTLRFELHEWSVFYASATGTGTITCDNKQSAKVTLRGKGGGLTMGKEKISNGRGSFTDVSDINELFGKYVAADTSAGAAKAADSQVMTKGEVSLAITGTGKGWELGFSMGEFTIQRRK